MKKIKSFLLVVVTLVVFFSCRKYDTHEYNYPLPERRIQYTLFTDKDFSENNRNITFTLSIKKKDVYGRIRNLWDSTFAPMRLSAIPKEVNKLVVTKTVPGNDPSELSVAFYYYLEDIGTSWLIDTCAAGVNFKAITLNYR